MTPETKSSKHIEVIDLTPKRRFQVKGKWIAFALLVVAVVLVISGVFSSHKVYTQEAREYGLDFSEEISDLELIEDATFSGVEFKEGKLYSNYDRSAGKSKRACPT